MIFNLLSLCSVIILLYIFLYKLCWHWYNFCLSLYFFVLALYNTTWFSTVFTPTKKVICLFNCVIVFFIWSLNYCYVCYSDCLGRRLGPRFLGRADSSGVIILSISFLELACALRLRLLHLLDKLFSLFFITSVQLTEVALHLSAEVG